MKNFIESKIINARLVIKARSTRLVDSLMNFDLVDLFENLTLLLAKTEFHLLKCDIKIPEFNQQLLMEPQKFKSDSFVNGRLVFCESHAPGYSMYFTYLKSMNEFYFALNEINDYFFQLVVSHFERRTNFAIKGVGEHSTVQGFLGVDQLGTAPPGSS